MPEGIQTEERQSLTNTIDRVIGTVVAPGAIINISNGRYRLRLPEAAIGWLVRQWPRSLEAVQVRYVWDEATGEMRIGLLPAEKYVGVAFYPLKDSEDVRVLSTPPWRGAWKSAAEPATWKVGDGQAFGGGKGTRVLEASYRPVEQAPLIGQLWRAGAAHTELSAVAKEARATGWESWATREKIKSLRHKYGVGPLAPAEERVEAEGSAKTEAEASVAAEIEAEGSAEAEVTQDYSDQLSAAVGALNEVLARAPDDWEIKGSVRESTGGGHFLRLSVCRIEEITIE